MKTLIIFYSRTGITRKVAEKIAGALPCDSEEIFDAKDRSGAAGFFWAGRDATYKNLTVLQPIARDPAQYDLVILGTPVWAFTVSTPMRTYIYQNKNKFKAVAFFCTENLSGGPRTFHEMKKLCGKKPLAVLELLAKEIIRGEGADKIKTFVDEIKKHSGVLPPETDK